MIIANGFIQFKTQQAGEIDSDTGYRSKPDTVEWGEPIPCQMNAVTFNLLSRTAEGEHFTKVSFEVFLEEYHEALSEQVRLTDRRGNLVGEFSVIEFKPLDAVCETRILV